MANRLQTLSGLGLNGEGRPKNLFTCTHLLGVCTEETLFYFCILVLLTPSIRRGRRNRLLTDLRVLNRPGRMFCASESSESSGIVMLLVLPQGELRNNLHWD